MDKADVNAIDSSVVHKPFPKIKGFKVHLDLKENAKPVQLPPRHAPGALIDKINEKIDELVQMDIIEEVNINENGGRSCEISEKENMSMFIYLF